MLYIKYIKNNANYVTWLDHQAPKTYEDTLPWKHTQFLPVTRFLYQKYTRKYHQMSFIKIKANTVSQQEQGQEGQLFFSSPVSLRLLIFKWRYLPLQVFQSCNGTIIPKYPVMFLILRKQQKIWRLLLLKIQHKKWKDLLYKI